MPPALTVSSVFELASAPVDASTVAASRRPTGAVREAMLDSMPAPEPVECEAVLQVRAAVVAELEVLRLDGLLRMGEHPPPAPPPHRAARSRVNLPAPPEHQP